MANLVKLTNYKRPWTGKDGQEHPSTNFYVEGVLPNGRTLRVPVKPALDKDADTLKQQYLYLEIICDDFVTVQADKKEGE